MQASIARVHTALDVLQPEDDSAMCGFVQIVRSKEGRTCKPGTEGRVS
jgi:hypothetical protein